MVQEAKSEYTLQVNIQISVEFKSLCLEILKDQWRRKSYTELEVERQKLEVESRFELKQNQCERMQLRYWNRRNL